MNNIYNLCLAIANIVRDRIEAVQLSGRGDEEKEFGQRGSKTDIVIQ